MNPDLLVIFERALEGITSVSVQKKTNDTYTLKSDHINTYMLLTIISGNNEDDKLKLKLSFVLSFPIDGVNKDILDGIIKAGFSLQENSPCKLIGITETDNELKVELVIFYTDYASVFSEADREDKYKESDFKLIVLSMLSELYSCSMGINNFISKTLLSALENIKKGTKDEEKR